MNRFVLIGNGFDLAHGLPTRYSDFLCWYLQKHLTNAISKRSVDIGDDLIAFNVPINLDVSFASNLSEMSFEDLISDKHINWNFENENRVMLAGTLENLRLEYAHDRSKVQVIYKSDFFKNILKDQNWTDIERSYYESVMRIHETLLKSKNNSDFGWLRSEKTTDIVRKHNKQFEILRSELIQYVTETNGKIGEINKMSPLVDLIDRLIEEPHVDYLSRYFKPKKPDPNTYRLIKNYFVNFNYTTLLSKYLRHKNVEEIQIHGSCVNPNEIIFGYGDDTHKKYQEIEESEINELMENMKAFYYPDSKKYMNLINSLDEDYFEVCVVGHSLGLSDRVLLKTIFEHENCRAIRLFHRGDVKSQFKSRIMLSRHFIDKQTMRKRIVDFDFLDKFPLQRTTTLLIPPSREEA